MVTDYSKLPRETFYACPHCMLRLELLTDDDNSSLRRIQVRTCGDMELNGGRRQIKLGEGVSSAVASRPSKSCRHYLGFLRSLPMGKDIPDECAVCPMIMKCYVKKE